MGMLARAYLSLPLLIGGNARTQALSVCALCMAIARQPLRQIGSASLLPMKKAPARTRGFFLPPRPAGTQDHG
jgi:hypothetical protein